MHLVTRNVNKRIVMKNMSISDRLWASCLKTNKKSCWNWWRKTVSKQGYGRINVNGKSLSAHRLAWELTYGKIPIGLLVLHKCDNVKCINPNHLFIGTDQTNQQDKVNKQRQARGQTHGNSKLTDEQRISIKRRYKVTSRGGSGNIGMARILAEEYDVTPQCIRLIARDKLSPHLRIKV